MPAFSGNAAGEASMATDICLLAAQPIAQLLLAFGEFGGQRIAEIFHFIEGTDFELARPRHRIGTTFRPRDRLVHILDFPDPIARDEFARLGERSVEPPADRAEDSNGVG